MAAFGHDPHGFSLLYYEIFPKNRTSGRRQIPVVNVGVSGRVVVS